jgi:TM2 domain-containing membrane protein YozV
MYCKNCGQYIPDNANVCASCGTPTNDVNFGPKEAACPHCGATINPNAAICIKCGCPVRGANPNAKSRLAAGLLGVFLGGLGIHRFYLGYNEIGLVQLLVSVLTCGIGAPFMSIWGFIEGILILCNTYITTDAKGVPLKD